MKSKLGKIIRMEFKLTAANKLFIVLTILGPFLIAAVTVLPSLIATSGSASPETRIALVGADSRFVEQVAPAFLQSKIRVTAVQESVESMDAMVLGGGFDGYVVLPADLSGATRLQYVSKNAADYRVVGVLQGVIGQSIVSQRLVKAGIAAAEVASLTQPPAFETRQLTKSGEKKSSDYLTVLLTGLMFAMLLYMTVLLYGQVIGRSVLTEKTSKTVEIMLSSVTPMQLLFGKILGKALASLLQYGVWMVISLAVLKLAGPALGVKLNLGIGFSTFVWLLVFFLLAFFLYSSIYAALGAASQDEQHLGQLAWPVILFLVLPVVFIALIIGSPQAPFVVFLSIFPLTAPIVMLLRIVVGGAQTWEIVASVGLLLATIAGVIWLSAKIFRVGLLMTGKRFTFAEVMRLARF
jgi:ABC-2 type transport system permease protein